jgi:cadmium resistance protein CadD (predicted permease)
VVGQYLGFTALTLVSLIGFFGGRILPHEWIRWLGIAPILLGLKKLIEKRIDVQGTGSNTLAVATVTFTNGADNIGVYAPLFAVSDAPRLFVLTGVLYSLLAVWCLTAYRIHRQQLVAATIRSYGQRLVPVILIGLGLYILLT